MTNKPKENRTVAFLRKHRQIFIAILCFLVFMILLALFNNQIASFLHSHLIFKKFVESLLQPAPLAALIGIVLGIFAIIPEIEKMRSKAEIDIYVDTIKQSNTFVNSLLPAYIESANVLSRELTKILSTNKDEYKALHKDFDPAEDENWSMTHEYQLNSVLYSMATYFANADIVSENVIKCSYLNEEDENYIYNWILNVSRSIGNYYSELPTHDELAIPEEYKKNLAIPDCQVYKRVQSSMGHMVTEDGKIISYDEYLLKKDENAFKEAKKLLIDLEVYSYRWLRLTHFRSLLQKVEHEFTELRNILRERMSVVIKKSNMEKGRHFQDIIEGEIGKIPSHKKDVSHNATRKCPFKEYANWSRPKESENSTVASGDDL